LVSVNERVDSGLKAGGEDLSDGLHDAFLERDRAKMERVVSRIGFWEENEKGAVNAGKIQGTMVKRGEHGKDIRGDKVPKG
jgi:hypothetical protein